MAIKRIRLNASNTLDSSAGSSSVGDVALIDLESVFGFLPTSVSLLKYEVVNVGRGSSTEPAVVIKSSDFTSQTTVSAVANGFFAIGIKDEDGRLSTTEGIIKSRRAADGVVVDDCSARFVTIEAN